MRLGKIGRGVMLLRMFGLSAKNAASSARFFSSVWKIGSSIIGSVIRNVLKLGSTFLQFGSNVIGFVVRQMLMLGGAFLRLGVMLLTTPIGIALTLLGVAAYMLYKNWDGVVGGAKALWQDLSNFIGGVVNSIASFFGTCWESIKAFFNSGIGNISAQIINWSPLGLFYQSFASVMSWFGVQLPSSFTQFGANIIQGLWNGLQSKFESVKAWFAEKAASLKQTFAGVMGIHSPSRVFRRFGGWMMDGLQIGLDGSAARPIASIDNTAGRLKSGFTDHMGALAARLSAGGEAFASARNTQAVGGMTINYNPTINAPGGNPQQIEAALQMGLREFEAMFRRMMDDKARRAY
nr:MAG TPA: tail tape measure protein [Caudoviricetes sp.]